MFVHFEETGKPSRTRNHPSETRYSDVTNPKQTNHSGPKEIVKDRKRGAIQPSTQKYPQPTLGRNNSEAHGRPSSKTLPFFLRQTQKSALHLCAKSAQSAEDGTLGFMALGAKFPFPVPKN